MPLAALAVLAINDHLLKGAGVLPGWLTGKLSDLAGLIFFPLLLTATLDTAALAAARLGVRIDFSLRRWKLIAATVATGAVFSALKLIPALPAAAESGAAALGWDIAIVCDPGDLVALPGLAVAMLLGEAEIARVPLGRIEAIERLGARTPAAIKARLADVAARRGGAPVRALAQGLAVFWAEGDDSAARDALRHLRYPSGM